MTKHCSLIIVLLFLWTTTNIVYAADLDFWLRLGSQFYNNLFRAPVDMKKDLSFMISPELALRLPFNRLYFSMSSRAALKQHTALKEANAPELTFAGFGSYKVSPYISLGLNDNFTLSNRLRTADILTDSPGLFRKYLDNTLTSSFTYDLRKKVQISLEYTNQVRNYRGSDEDDWMKHGGRLGLKYSLGVKTFAQVNLAMIGKGYDTKDLDYTNIPVAISIGRKLSEKINTNLSFGFENRSYDNDDSKINKSIIDLDITGRFTHRTTSRLKIRRGINDSDVTAGEAFVSSSVNAESTLSLSDKARLILQGLYNSSDYIQRKRKEDMFRGSAAVLYALSKWGAVALKYSYESRFSDIPSREYRLHIIDFFWSKKL